MRGILQKITHEQKERMEREVVRLHAEYANLVNLRLDEMKMPEEMKSIKTPVFIKLERDINERSSALKYQLGTLASAETLVCQKCLGLFHYIRKPSENFESYVDCREHKGRTDISKVAA